jgi:hypothetical protein
MESNSCPSCGKPTVVPGHLVGPENSPITYFAPASARYHVKLRIVVQACTSCGHVGTAVSPYELRSLIERHGNELVKQHLELLEKGRYHDLPDIPEAHQAADRVAELDGWILAGISLEAVRRYHQLTGQSWDDVHRSMAKWTDLKRPRKLALLGWRPKGLLDDEDVPGQREHPMHDDLLDG